MAPVPNVSEPPPPDLQAADLTSCSANLSVSDKLVAVSYRPVGRALEIDLGWLRAVEHGLAAICAGKANARAGCPARCVKKIRRRFIHQPGGDFLTDVGIGTSRKGRKIHRT